MSDMSDNIIHNFYTLPSYCPLLPSIGNAVNGLSWTVVVTVVLYLHDYVDIICVEDACNAGRGSFIKKKEMRGDRR